MYLEENNLASTNTYNKEAMQCNLLLAIIDILESLSPDSDTEEYSNVFMLFTKNSKVMI